MKQLKTDYLPHLAYQNTKVNTEGKQAVVKSDFNKKMKSKARVMDPKIEELSRDYNNEL